MPAPTFVQRLGFAPYTCQTCGRSVFVVLGRCPSCQTLIGQGGDQGQLIRVYRGSNLEAQFKRDAAALARAGWVAGTPSYGGERRVGVTRVALFGVLALAGSRKPSSMTVVYTRQA